MEKTKKIKIYIGIFYLIFVGLFLYYFFSKFSIEEITSYDFIKNNRDYFSQIKKTNLLFFSFIFVLFTIIWVLAAGFVSPIVIFSGFVFGKWLGSIIVITGLSVGATLFYLFANFFLKDLIEKKFLNKFKGLEEKFKKSEFAFLLIYRFIGGIPFVISNVVPCMFNVKALNFFGATFLGIFPQVFLLSAIGDGLDKIIDQNLETPRIRDIIGSPDIYIPIIIFICLILITVFLRKLFYKK
tara:strand:- start:1472 stop:2191 length:720 start_codon:yes stop_codon:yes gene_type:complete